MLSVALKHPDGTSYGEIENDSDEWKMGEDINVWIQRKCGGFSDNVILYNDEEPNDTHATGTAHAKGILVWNSDRIGWLIHSVPGYPTGYPLQRIEDRHLIYGQSFAYLEIPFKEEALGSILSQLQKMDAHVYHSSIGWTHTPCSNQEPTTISFSDDIRHVSKHKKWGKDLFEEHLTIVFESPILCQTWAKPAIPSSILVKNVKTVKWPNGLEYETTNDHSKYAVSMNPEHKWVYIGDINHMESQARRGGGGLLIRNERLWLAFNHILSSFSEVVANPNRLGEETGCCNGCLAICLGCMLLPCVPCIRCLRWAVED